MSRSWSQSGHFKPRPLVQSCSKLSWTGWSERHTYIGDSGSRASRASRTRKTRFPVPLGEYADSVSVERHRLRHLERSEAGGTGPGLRTERVFCKFVASTDCRLGSCDALYA